MKKTLEEGEAKISELERELKNTVESSKGSENKFLTEKALLEQKLEFTQS